MSEAAENDVLMHARLASAGRAPNPSALSDKVRSLRLSEQTLTRRGKPWLPWTLCAIFAAATVFYASRDYYATSSTNPNGNPETPSSPADSSATSSSSQTASSASASGDVVLESKGYIIPAHQILVSPKVSGMIESLRVEEGLRMKKGEVIGQLETTDYQADLDRAKATLGVSQQKLLELERGNRPEEVQQAKAELEETVAQREQLQSAWQRSIKLRANKTITENDYEQAESSYKAMERRAERLKNSYDLMVKGARIERIDLARAEVNQAKADVAKAEWRLENCTIRAPITGTILKKNAEEGNIVNPIAFNGSFSLCDMADLSDLEVDLSIQERDVSRVFKGQKCTVRAEAFPERIYTGYVSRLMPIADRAKGAVPVRVKLKIPAEEEGVYLKPEMGAVVSFFKADSSQDKTGVPDKTAAAEKTGK